MSLAADRRTIGIHRHFTTPGQHPYDEVAWQHRVAKITNWSDGSVAFEQNDVEFPESWSQNATNIVAQKYFRGTLGLPEREHSLRQVIDRVADTITAWGTEGGYFADTSEAETFNAELKHILVHQKAAFNSPVWFNIGVPGVPAQASACQPYHSMVSTPAGLVPIGQLVEGDAVGAKVYDAHGVTSIVAVKHNGVRQVQRVHTKAGYTLDVTGDHLVWRVSGEGSGAWVPAGELVIGDKLRWTRAPSWGEVPFNATEVAEAALAGWLQTDGFVGQYNHGTNRSLTIEFLTVTEDELTWVTEHLNTVFPHAHRHVRTIELQDPKLVGRRVRLYGEHLRPFVEKWGLMARGAHMQVPPALFTAAQPVVAAYLRSAFQAEGYVSLRDRTARVGLDMVGEAHVRGLQSLLTRFGIFARVRRKDDRRADRQGTWSLSIQPLGERDAFATELPFIDRRKRALLEESLSIPGRMSAEVKVLEIGRIEMLGDMDVYDIQTESGEYLSSGGLRVHNCFILAVDDTMDSILNWYREEGIIFKGGSGAGVNLSNIRSSKELLKGGGTASGPVSFMRGADASAGTIKSGGKTRRAAKMVILNADHPDVEEFIWCKAREERKARVLRDAGFDMDLDGQDAISIQYQNANNSVRVTDEFMQAVVDDADWHLKAVMTGEVVRTVRARDLWREIATAAWECADPGLQFDTTINKWHTAHATGRINGSNPCSEYVHLDNSACNLASINLLTFLDEHDEFDVEGYRQTVEVVFTAQEILVGRADYPTEKIGETTRAFRQLGLGYANLGALLMALGLPYDSEDGRAWAAALTSLMTGHAYATSARIASRMGPFSGFPENERHMLNVLGMHRDANELIARAEVIPADLRDAATEAWESAVRDGEEYGVRNSQASVLAPTGTISFMMDCDTTGIEPDLGLVKTKKLVGGGTMSIVNQTIPRALVRLGYTPDQVIEITAYVAEHHSIVGAPHLAADHLPVFACSMGDNTIHYVGHVRMMGAVQPFLSGAISKTVNTPETSTVEDIEALHLLAWQLGLKAVAIYRDNCKVAQPLSTSKPSAAANPETQAVQVVERIVERIVPQAVRQKLPRSRKGRTFEFRVADCKGFATIGEYEDGRPGEIFLTVSKQGSTLSGIMDAFAKSISYGLQYGVPIRAFVEAFTNMRFEPMGMTDDPDIRFASSIMDYLFRRLALEYLTYDERAELGIYSIDERLQPTLPGVDEASITTLTGTEMVPDPKSIPGASDLQLQLDSGLAPAAPHTDHSPAHGISRPASDAPMCMDCGVQMHRAGACHVCPSCGNTSGCS
jgi:adenosylcobalamin-dependent ribonucleoside-diphosphate reductase